MALSACFRLSPAFVLLLAAGQLSAAQPSETLLPNTTKGFISTQDVDEVRTKFTGHVQTLFAGAGGNGLAADLRDHVRQQRARIELIVDHEDELALQVRLNPGKVQGLS